MARAARARRRCGECVWMHRYVVSKHIGNPTATAATAAARRFLLRGVEALEAFDEHLKLFLGSAFVGVPQQRQPVVGLLDRGCVRWVSQPQHLQVVATRHRGPRHSAYGDGNLGAWRDERFDSHDKKMRGGSWSGVRGV